MAGSSGYGVPVKTRLNVSGPQNLPQALSGDIIYCLVLSGDIALTIGKGRPAERQSMTLVIQQPVYGGCETTWPSDVRWVEGRIPFIDSRPGSIIVVTMTRFDESGLIFGRLGF
ncbi:hypothetical protein CGLAMM_07135 [Acetobacteraceae bacterium EV16G]|uniref:Uncharacterized protein n=1 Tax=Sorlinia euscelidii TaxID=3081148 RepID=A0ABU7U6K3_9PROT